MPKNTEITLPTYAEYRPTAFDMPGKGLEERQDWLVCPVSITRDTESPLELSNWACFVKSLEAVNPGEDFEIHRFGHWGPGWFEIILVRPGTPCALEAQELANALESYPVLDDEDHSRREFDLGAEIWANASVRTRLDAMRATNCKACCLAARHSDVIPEGGNECIETYLASRT